MALGKLVCSTNNLVNAPIRCSPRGVGQHRRKWAYQCAVETVGDEAVQVFPDGVGRLVSVGERAEVRLR